MTENLDEIYGKYPGLPQKMEQLDSLIQNIRYEYNMNIALIIASDSFISSSFTGELTNLKNDELFLQSLCFSLANIVRQLYNLITVKVPNKAIFNEFTDSITMLLTNLQTQMFNIISKLDSISFEHTKTTNQETNTLMLSNIVETMSETINLIKSRLSD